MICEKIGRAVDDLVRDLYSPKFDGLSAIQEPEISSRICQRLEDRLDGERAGSYIFRVIAQSLPDRGPQSMEKIIGADIFMSISLDGEDGFDKGIFIQSKYDRNIRKDDLEKCLKKMQRISGNIGSYVWIYTPEGVQVFSAYQVEMMEQKSFGDQVPRSVEGFAARVLDCNAGSRSWGISGPPNQRRVAVAKQLRKARAANIVDLQLRKAKRSNKAGN